MTKPFKYTPEEIKNWKNTPIREIRGKMYYLSNASNKTVTVLKPVKPNTKVLVWPDETIEIFQEEHQKSK